MERQRKSYLLYRSEEGKCGEEVKGVFSSLKKAREAVRMDASALIAGTDDGRHVFEVDKERYFLKVSDGRKFLYRIEGVIEDKMFALHEE